MANRVFELIVQYEISQTIPINIQDDFEIDDEIITEEEFLRNVDNEIYTEEEFLRNLDEDLEDQDLSDNGCELEQQMDKLISNRHEVEDEINDNLDIIFDPTQDQTEVMASISSEQARAAIEKMEKICVAPGEGGKFQNWKEDLFLEEKSFPDKFPYGTGGYLSSIINHKGNYMGFANYCINQIMSCDPKFRQDSAYVFFLLLVKELIQLKHTSDKLHGCLIYQRMMLSILIQIT